jgi:hypothetical protein
MSAEIGILLVHGIGSQVRGETLINFGEPIYETLKDWAEPACSPPDASPGNSGPGQASVQDKSAQLIDAFVSPLINVPSASAEPPHIRFTLPNPGNPPVEWVMAECHWATAFPPPLARTVTYWIMRALPWIFLSFVARRLRMTSVSNFSMKEKKSLGNTIKVIAITLTLTLVLTFLNPLILLIELCLVGLLIMGLFPIKAIQEFIRRVNDAISAILGDCFIFASSDFRQLGVITKLLADMSWLEGLGCKRIVVIAHSQGAAVAYLALKKQLGRASLLITFGAGILKLQQLTGRDRWREIGWFAILTQLMALMVIVLIAGWANLPIPTNNWFMGLFTAQALFLFLLVVMPAFSDSSDEFRFQASEFARQGLKWIDIYASMDPVPNGPILLPTSEHLQSVEICNQSSFISDHTSYMKNRDEVLPLIVDAIARYSGTALRMRRLSEYGRSVSVVYRRLRISAERSIRQFC